MVLVDGDGRLTHIKEMTMDNLTAIHEATRVFVPVAAKNSPDPYWVEVSKNEAYRLLASSEDEFTVLAEGSNAYIDVAV
jgi:hypothetical protein